MCLSTLSTTAPILATAPRRTLISLTSGTLSIVTVSSAIIAAAMIAKAAFLAPIILTSPLKGFPPLITYCSITYL